MAKAKLLTEEQADQLLQEFIKHLREFFKEEIDSSVRDEVKKEVKRVFREMGRY